MDGPSFDHTRHLHRLLVWQCALPTRSTIHARARVERKSGSGASGPHEERAAAAPLGPIDVPPFLTTPTCAALHTLFTRSHAREEADTHPQAKQKTPAKKKTATRSRTRRALFSTSLTCHVFDHVLTWPTTAASMIWMMPFSITRAVWVCGCGCGGCGCGGGLGG